ncbi:Transmembrane domain-containing protein [Spironucleus salmonicida]|uniref:Transmembrane domain-containing protein n=1 Tax=Spironucleus salmonicida TaxID=348837 RepID=V6M2Q6_9EUKA|nr:Transmembrane domain-containing protein [Spironucleus salmonicida]|eukprot:EST47544.1 Transmembrane domain-containing protein [Spironucleus salmonicida]
MLLQCIYRQTKNKLTTVQLIFWNHFFKWSNQESVQQLVINTQLILFVHPQQNLRQIANHALRFLHQVRIVVIVLITLLQMDVSCVQMENVLSAPKNSLQIALETVNRDLQIVQLASLLKISALLAIKGGYWIQLQINVKMLVQLINNVQIRVWDTATYLLNSASLALLTAQCAYLLNFASHARQLEITLSQLLKENALKSVLILNLVNIVLMALTQYVLPMRLQNVRVTMNRDVRLVMITNLDVVCVQLDLKNLVMTNAQNVLRDMKNLVNYVYLHLYFLGLTNQAEVQQLVQQQVLWQEQLLLVVDQLITSQGKERSDVTNTFQNLVKQKLLRVALVPQISSSLLFFLQILIIKIFRLFKHQTKLYKLQIVLIGQKYKTYRILYEKYLQIMHKQLVSTYCLGTQQDYLIFKIKLKNFTLYRSIFLIFYQFYTILWKNLFRQFLFLKFDDQNYEIEKNQNLNFIIKALQHFLKLKIIISQKYSCFKIIQNLLNPVMDGFIVQGTLFL